MRIRKGKFGIWNSCLNSKFSILNSKFLVRADVDGEALAREEATARQPRIPGSDRRDSCLEETCDRGERIAAFHFVRRLDAIGFRCRLRELTGLCDGRTGFG